MSIPERTNGSLRNYPSVGLVSDIVFRDHETTDDHPENSRRLNAIDDLLDDSGLRSQCVPIDIVPIDELALRRVHDHSLLTFLADADRRAELNSVFIDSDTVMNERSYSVSRLASGVVLRASQLVAVGDLDSVFCILRPPGHHAGRFRSMGFCLINHVAVAAADLMANRLTERVVVIDFDVHHGNGTQEIFYENPDLLYISIHQDPLYPGTGHIEERGRGVGFGTTLNLPLPPGCGDAAYLICMDEVVIPSVLRFSPTIIFISAGFDAHWRDPLSHANVSCDGFNVMTEKIQTVAAEIGAGTVYSLEGGYDLEALAWSVRGSVDKLLENPTVADPIGCPRMSVVSDINPVIEQAKILHEL